MSRWSWVTFYFLFLKTEFIITGYELPENIVYHNSKILEIFLSKCNIPITDSVPHSSYSRKEDFMYLSEEKLAAVRACIENQHSNLGINSGFLMQDREFIYPKESLFRGK